MSMKHLHLVITSTVLLGLTACASSEPTEKDLKRHGHYWQRAHVTEAAYMHGPKAQQMLNRDISRCVVELRELERLHAIRHVTPGETTAQGEAPDPDTPAGSLTEWDTPERDGMLRAEHLDYHDFEGCMVAKGWERMEHLPYDVAERARATYIETTTGQKPHFAGSDGQRFKMAEEEGDWEELNE